MKARRFAAVVVTRGISSSARAADKQPNIVLILADNFGYANSVATAAASPAARQRHGWTASPPWWLGWSSGMVTGFRA